ncbi:MAG: DNA-primase RepB domain-containing protein, partial [Gemmataceae bacterium]
MTTSTTGNPANAPRTPQEFLRHFPDCWIQYFDDGPGKDSSKALSTSDFDPKEAARKQKQGCGVFFSPNAFDGLRRSGNLKRVQAVFVDLDLAGPGTGGTRQSLGERLRRGLEALMASPLPPHVVVRTRNGLQAVWRVEPLAPADGLVLFGEVEDLLVARFGADPAAKDVTRVLRLPGFLHLKDPDSPFLCRLL